MNNIGAKIKELRTRCGLTQERVAEFLCVSYQAVSKWETGVTCPDLSMIVPLARLFHVSTDELLGLSEPENDMRRAEFDRAMREGWRMMEDEEVFALAEAAVKEYPGDMRYLAWLAREVFLMGIGLPDEAEFLAAMERAVKLDETVMEFADRDLKYDAVHDIVMPLVALGRRDEAMNYAKSLPDGRADKAEAIAHCLQGEAKRHSTQQKLLDELNTFLLDLTLCGFYESYDAFESILKVLFPHGDYMYNMLRLSIVCIDKASALVGRGEHEKAVTELRRAMELAVKYDDAFVYSEFGEHRHTSPLFDTLTFDTRELFQYKIERAIDHFVWRLDGIPFDPIRGREDFAALQAKAAKIAEKPLPPLP